MSSDGERSPKRQRRSYSPPSPAVPETKGHSFVHQPQTPPPSVHISPSCPAQTSTFQPAGSVTFPTPPSTSGFFSQQKGVGSEGEESGQHTPAPESDERRDGDGDAEMADVQQRGEAEDEGDASIHAPAAEEDAGHRRTDHERQASPPNDPPPDALPPPPPRLYKLRTTPIAPTRPHPSQNLIDLYSLQSIQASVARRDAAGNKINKLRKSYEGKVKALGLEGRGKAQTGNHALEGLVDPMWDMEVGNGRTLWEQERVAELPLGEAWGEREVLGKLGSALSLRPGQMPKGEHEQWKAILGLDEPEATPAVSATTPGLLPANLTLTKTAPAQAMRHSAPTSPGQGGGGARPERAGKKRRYDEASYAGYHEGYDDDGYSTGGDSAGRRGSASKRQKTGSVGGAPAGRKVSALGA